MQQWEGKQTSWKDVNKTHCCHMLCDPQVAVLKDFKPSTGKGKANAAATVIIQGPVSVPMASKTCHALLDWEQCHAGLQRAHISSPMLYLP